jgi:hypothetical protein
MSPKGNRIERVDSAVPKIEMESTGFHDVDIWKSIIRRKPITPIFAM